MPDASASALTVDGLSDTTAGLWSDAVLPSLSELVRIPAMSPAFDDAWAEHGHLDAAVAHVEGWIAGRGLPDARTEVVRLPGRTPLLLVDVPATAGARAEGAVLMYGHLDKQPPMEGWSAGLGPWTPVVRDGRLFGRGASDDGYSGYAAITALEALRAHGGEHARVVVVLEASEESGSPDLPAYLDHLRDRLGDVTLVVCLDSGAMDYDRMWLTTSLRGLVQVALDARVLDVAQHSGSASGVVPSSFRVLRQLLDRVEDATTGRVRLPELHVDVPADRLAEIDEAARLLPDGTIAAMFPTVAGLRLAAESERELILNRTWRPTLSVTGAGGLPAPADAGNVLRANTTLALSFRLPPTVDSDVAREAVLRALTADIPYAARVGVDRIEAADGWNAPTLAPWLRAALDQTSTAVFGQPWLAHGEGGSIPFMGLLSAAYPRAQFLVTGAAGPGSNAHVPDESLHLGFAAKVTAGVSVVLAAHAVAG